MAAHPASLTTPGRVRGAKDPASRSECIAFVLAADVRERDAERLE
jgi:phage gp29-like protein